MGKFDDVLLTVDYDRTLTAQDSTIPERNLEAIRYFIDNGGTFTVNTGRSVPMARSFLEQVPVNAPLLLYNGSAAYDAEKGEFLFCHPIDLDLWETVNWCLEHFPDMVVEVQGQNAHYRFVENPMWDAFCAYNRCASAAARPGDDLGPFLKFAVYGQLRDVKVADLFVADGEELVRIEAVGRALEARFGHKCEIFRSGTRIFDVHTKGVSKARSARELQKALGKKLLVCVGDAHNDISMLDGADYAFVPSDAALADRYENVCPCGEGAVADVIYKKIPEILQKQP